MLDWLLLTKRPEQMPLLTPSSWKRGWPPNVWAGTTTGTRPTLELRVPRLRKVPCATRFISGEPLLEDVFAKPFDLSGIHWGILGGESDPIRSKARVCDEAWIRNGLRAFSAAGVAPFVKQVGSNPEVPQKCGDCDPCLAGERCYQQYNVRLTLIDSKGGDPQEWARDLRVREFPEVRR